jgi:endonuclease G
MKKILVTLLITSTHVFAVDLNSYINDKNCNQIVTNQVFKACYDYNLKGSRYVAYTVIGTKISDADVHIKKRPSFYPENSIPVKYRSYPDDYTHSGYDRGHMANHADFDYSANLVYMTYSMANIVPQNPEVNRKTWVKAEKYERTIAKKLGYVNVLNIITYSNTPQRLGKHQIAVPSDFIKVIYNDDKGFKKCFSYHNNQPRTEDDSLKNHEVSCSMILIR